MPKSKQTNFCSASLNENVSCVIAENIASGVFIYSDNEVIYANEYFFKTFGYLKDEIYRRKGVFQLIAPDNYFIPLQYFEKLLNQTIEEFHYQLKAKTRLGDTIYLSSYASAIEIDGKKSILCSFQDVTSQKLVEKEIDNLASFPELNPFPVIETDNEGIITYLNPTAKKTFPELIPEHGPANILMLFDFSSSLDKESSQSSFEYKNKFYHKYYYSIPRLNRFRFYIVDYTERKYNQEQLSLASQVFRHTTEGIMITDPEGSILSVNPAFTKITGHEPEEIVGKNPRILKSERHDSEFYDEMWTSLLTKGEWQGEIWNRRKSGEAYLGWLNINAVKDPMGQVSQYIGIFTDITDLKQFKKDVEYLSHHDPLTGFPNRVLLQDRVLFFISHPMPEKEKIAILFVNLDRFKNINNTLGHIVGDMLLIEAARRIKEYIPAQATIARIGADEFAVAIPHITDIESVARIAETIINNVSKPLVIKNQELFITTSIGISIYPDDGDGIKTLFQNADIALNRAKEKGGNQYQLYKPEMNVQAFENLILETHLRKALGNNEFFLTYQPQIDSRNGKLIGVEALIRWKKPSMGVISPGKFIPLAEETGTIIPIGEWVLYTAASQLKSWLAQGYPPIKMSINLSGIQFRQPNIVDKVKNVIEITGIPVEDLMIEITESVTMHNVEEAIQILKKFQQLGLQIAIDDFGTGYSSLSYLKKFPIHKLKIDRAFIVDLSNNHDDRAISNTIIQLARNMGLQVIAEGVESKEQIDLLYKMGCYEIQGYFYSPPITAKEIEEKFLKKLK